MLHAARCLLTNKQGGDLAQMEVSETLNAEGKTLGAIVVHSIAVLFSNSKTQVLLPFIDMFENPASLAVRLNCNKEGRFVDICLIGCLFSNNG